MAGMRMKLSKARMGGCGPAADVHRLLVHAPLHLPPAQLAACAG